MARGLNLYAHLLLREPTLPPMPAPLTYVVASTGVYLWAKRAGLEVLIPVAPCTLHGLAPVQPFVRLQGLPRLDGGLVEQLLRIGVAARGEDGRPVETLFFLSNRAGAWELVVPPQVQTPVSVVPIRQALDAEAYSRVLMEIHTHPGMPAYFSTTDDLDERGFRLYGVIGNATGDQTGTITAEVRLRVVVYDPWQASYEFPASWVMALPAGVTECPPITSWPALLPAGQVEEDPS